jgi:hypothetical protein
MRLKMTEVKRENCQFQAAFGKGQNTGVSDTTQLATFVSRISI